MTSTVVEMMGYDPPRAYAACSRAGNMVFVAGETGFDPETRTFAEGIEAQTEQALKNIGQILERAGSGLEHIVRLTVYLINIDDRLLVSKVRERVLPGPLPPSTAIGIASLSFPEMLVEIEATAVVPT